MSQSERSTDPCKEDLTRRERAASGSSLTEVIGPMKRTIDFHVGYDHRKMGCGHGQHGMEMEFRLQGPGGVIVWRITFMAMVPGNLDIIDTVESLGPVSVVPSSRSRLDVMGMDLGYHSPVEQYEGQTRRDDCHLLPDEYCYYDGSGLNAGPVLRAFMEHGPMAVWASMVRYYQELFGGSHD